MTAVSSGTEVSDAEVVAQHNDLEMLRRPHLWPHGHLLPMKRNRGADREYIVVAFTGEEGTKRYLVSEGLMGMEPKLVATGDDFLLRMLVDSGWMVD